MKNKEINKQEYNIIDNYTFIEIPDKDYGYYVLGGYFAIKHYYYDEDDCCEDMYYTEIKFDNMTGYKIEIDEELQACINKAKVLRKRLELKWKKEEAERKKEAEKEQKRCRKRWRLRQKLKYKEYIKKFGRKEAKKIMLIPPTPAPTEFGKMFENCHFLTTIPDLHVWTQQDEYVKKLQEKFRKENGIDQGDEHENI